VSGQCYALAALSQRKEPRYTLDKRLVKNLDPAGTRTPAHSQSLRRLRYGGSCVSIYIAKVVILHVRWDHCPHSMARPRVADGGTASRYGG
jgi:hypothetical protein